MCDLCNRLVQRRQNGSNFEFVQSMDTIEFFFFYLKIQEDMSSKYKVQRKKWLNEDTYCSNHCHFSHFKYIFRHLVSKNFYPPLSETELKTIIAKKKKKSSTV